MIIQQAFTCSFVRILVAGLYCNIWRKLKVLCEQIISFVVLLRRKYCGTYLTVRCQYCDITVTLVFITVTFMWHECDNIVTAAQLFVTLMWSYCDNIVTFFVRLMFDKCESRVTVVWHLCDIFRTILWC